MDKQFREIKSRGVAFDTVYTPKPVALKMIEMCDLKPGDTVLDPCYGGGVFYENLPDYVDKEFCEIELALDFFDYEDRVDCVVGNPPYSLWSKWLRHTVKITDKFCYIFGNLNFTDKRVREILDAGFGITKFHLVKINWWFSPSYLVVFEKNKPSIITVEPKPILCDVCNGICKRGRDGNSYNTCAASRLVNGLNLGRQADL